MSRLPASLVVALMLPFVPLLAARLLYRRWRAARIVAAASRGARDLGPVVFGSFRDGELELCLDAAGARRERFRPRQVTSFLLEGDAGFADANSQTYASVGESMDGERIVWTMTSQGSRDVEVMRSSLREAGVSMPDIVLPDATGGGMIFALTVLWFAVVGAGTVLCAWLG